MPIASVHKLLLPNLLAQLVYRRFAQPVADRQAAAAGEIVALHALASRRLNLDQAQPALPALHQRRSLQLDDRSWAGGVASTASASTAAR